MKKGIEIAKLNKCGLIQLTSNKERLKATNFYKKLGFLSTHKSFKLDIYKKAFLFTKCFIRVSKSIHSYFMNSHCISKDILHSINFFFIFIF